MTPRPTSPLSVDADIRRKAAHVLDAPVGSIYYLEGGPYPYLYGMATALLSDANVEIVRLEKRIAELEAELEADCA